MAVARGLGKGLDTLIPKNVDESKEAEGEGSVETKVKITKIEPNREQPRKNMEEESLQELADSISQFGLLQPILVQKKKDHYEIIAGERRWRAAKMAGLKEVPVIIKDYTEQEAVEISLIENIQRQSLNPIEEARAYKRLIDEFHLTQEEIGQRVSKSRTAITNSMRLLKLGDKVQQMVADDVISTGHARALLGLSDPTDQEELAQRIADEKLSVRDVEKLVKNWGKTPRTRERKEDRELEAIYQEIGEGLKQKLNTKVSVIPRGKGAGKIEIEFYSNDDLERLLDLLG